MRDATARRRAVTLLELLVTIAATIVLTSILIVTIRGVRGQTLVMQDLNNLRLSAQDMLAWSVENDSKFLNIESTESRLYRTVFFFDPSPPPSRFWDFYYSQPIQWNMYLSRWIDGYHLNWQSAYGLPSPVMGFERQHQQHAEMWDRGDPQVAAVLSRIRYTLTLVTRPELWDDKANAISGNASNLSAYARPVRLGDVRFPSSKGMLANLELSPDDSHIHAAYVDGSAERRALSETIQPAINPAAFSPAIGSPVHHTKHGYLGRDR